MTRAARLAPPTHYDEYQRTAAALLAQGSRLGILAPRSVDDLARLDAIADGPAPRPKRQRPDTLPVWGDLTRAAEAPSLPLFELEP